MKIGDRGRFKRALRAKVVTQNGITKERVWRKSRGICEICNRPVTLRETTIDHSFPLSRGGSHTMANVIAAHAACNHAKGDKTILEMVADGSLRRLQTNAGGVQVR